MWTAQVEAWAKQADKRQFYEMWDFEDCMDELIEFLNVTFH